MPRKRRYAPPEFQLNFDDFKVPELFVPGWHREPGWTWEYRPDLGPHHLQYCLQRSSSDGQTFEACFIVVTSEPGWSIKAHDLKKEAEVNLDVQIDEYEEMVLDPL